MSPDIDEGAEHDPAEERCFREGRRIMRSWTELFGQPVVFVPMGRRSKRPRLTGWPSFTLELMQDERFIACIGRPNTNVAVSLGTPSGGLCTFDFDDDRNAETFLELNPTFNSTLATTAYRGRNLWFVVDGDYPASFDVKDEDDRNIVEFRADGRLTIMNGSHPRRYSYRLIKEARPIRIRWSEINWPREWANQVLPLRTARVQTHKEAGDAATDNNADSLLDRSKLTNVQDRDDGAYVARCPACAEQGHDETGNHLIVYPNGAFGCVVFTGDNDNARKHRSRIRQLIN